MRKALLTYLIVTALGMAFASAQNRINGTLQDRNNRDRYGNQIDPSTQPDNLEDSTHTEIQSLAPRIFMWKISETLGNQVPVETDTVSLNFQNSNLVEGMTGHYNYLGNLGSPRQSRLFFERQELTDNIFLNPFSSYLVRPDQFKFTNSNVPYTNLTYYKAGSKVDGEERFKTYFSVNANKRFAFGFAIDYLYGRGLYSNQSTAYFNAGLFASYIGKKYQMHAIFYNNFLRMNENGGITDDQYITHPQNMAEGKKEYEAGNIPVKLDHASNRVKNFYVYLTHRYRIGFDRKTYASAASSAAAPAEPLPMQQNDSLSTNPDEHPALGRPAPKDSVLSSEFIPVTSLIHTIKVERTKHRYSAQQEPADFYSTAYLDPYNSKDSTTAFSVKNTVGIALLEGFNKYAKAGLTAYVSHKYSRYELMNVDTTTDMRRMQYSEQELFVGGELAKRQGHTLHYNLNGEVGVANKAMGQFRLHADLDLNFRLWKDTVNFFARGYVTNTLPSFYMRHYHSNHYSWDNEEMDKELRTRVEGELAIKRWGTNLKAGVENLKNYTHFGTDGRPSQYGGNVQVLSATLTQNFKLGIFHLDNEVTWQKSSKEQVLPLPQLSLYHNVYLLSKLAHQVLTLQLGADVRYFSKYYAPAYSPATQQFHLQPENDRVELGGYPIVNVYANLHLKRTRIFAMMYHVNAGMGSPNYFLVPHYPINPRMFKVGLSWNFYD